ncbi:MAG TPA: hypothetical protein VE075_03445 [Thermoanaerobaculia bacterium]|nr:hypothetical protein [Thermoanaerobaculia bacterium]
MARGRAVVLGFATLLLLMPAIAPKAASAANKCGAERRDIKSGFDDAAKSIDPSSPTPATVATLAAKDAPNPIPKDTRVADAETTVWVVDATLTSFKLETDSDYHLVLDDGAGSTMIAEIPSPDCIAEGTSAFADKISSARSQLDAQFTASSQFQDADVPVHVTGVGLFDFSHGQRGFAANGIELHPVLDIQFTGGGEAAPAPSPEGAAAPSLLAHPAAKPGVLHLWTAMRLFQPDEAEGGVKPARSWRASGGAAVAMGAGPAAGAAPGAAPATPAAAPGTAAPSAIAPRPGTAAPTAAAVHRPLAQGTLATGGKQAQTLHQDLDVPAGASDAELRFAIHVVSDQQARRAARLRVQVRDLSGKRPAATVHAYSNLDANPGFDDQVFDLSRFRGHKVRIAFVASGRRGTTFTIHDARLALRK